MENFPRQEAPFADGIKKRLPGRPGAPQGLWGAFLPWAALLVYGLSILAANWLIRNVGIPIPGGTHLVPVGLGLLAPSGTLAAGVTLVSRDVVQRLWGRWVGLAVIAVGVALTALLDLRLALASGVAFAFSELAEFVIYTRFQRRGWVRVVFLSALLAAVLDSLIFLSLAGIPLQVALAGQLLGKAEVICLASVVIVFLRPRLPAPRFA